MFWPGSDVEIGGQRPKTWRLYDGEVPNRDRVQEVIRWLRLPDGERPTFITLYFSDVDSVGHGHGPESAEVLEAATALDRRRPHAATRDDRRRRAVAVPSACDRPRAER